MLAHGLIPAPRPAAGRHEVTKANQTREGSHYETDRNCVAKLDRMEKALRHQEGDRVPIERLLLGSSLIAGVKNWVSHRDTDIYSYYDLDWKNSIRTWTRTSNPSICLGNDEEIVVRTGFEAVIQKKLAYPMPAFLNSERTPWRKWRHSSSIAYGTSTATFSPGGRPDQWRRRWICAQSCPFRRSRGRCLEGFSRLWGASAKATNAMAHHRPETNLLWMGLSPDKIARFVETHNAFSLEI